MAVLALVLVGACDGTDEPTATSVPEATATTVPGAEATATATSAPDATATATSVSEQPTPEEGSRLEIVKERGHVICAGRVDVAGYGFLDSAGNNRGFDVDLCRAVAAAIFGDPTKLEILPITAAERGPTIQGGEVDMLSRTVTWTSTRDSQWGNYTIITFYDGQGFMARADSGITSALDLDGASVCVTSGTTTELNLADFFRQNNMELQSVLFEDTGSVTSAYKEGRCDAFTNDRSQLAAIRSGLEDPDAHVILPETISKEPLTTMVPHGDDQWFDLVKVVLFVLINAEEMGVTQDNVDAMISSDNVKIRRMLGAEGEFGQSDLGLDTDFAVDVIKGVGNFGEIYDRFLGSEGLGLPRGLNALWTDGGLIYAPPLR
jgi:general L-amino acid transport system substrate-binding protein